MRSLAHSAVLDTVLCFAAVFGLGSTLVPDYRHVADVDYVATDFKTLYSAATLLAAEGDPYQVQALSAVYRRDGVVEQPDRYGSMPVYPPVTLQLIEPLTRLSMTTAARCWLGLSLTVYAAALAMLLGFARRESLSLPWRLALAAAAAAAPSFAYALEVGNASVAVTALGVAAWLWVEQAELEVRRKPSWRGVAAAVSLAIGLMLKPHLACWILIALALFAGRRGRFVALGSIALAGLFVALSSLALATRGAFASTMHSYAAVLIHESAAGSMSVGSREVLPLQAQITSLGSLTHAYLPQHAANWCAWLALACLGAGLMLAAWRLRDGPTRGADASLAVASVVAFGLVASYHRAHDSLALMPLLFWIAYTAARWREHRLTTKAAAFLLAAVLLLAWIPLPGSLFSVRQAAFSYFLLATTLVSVLTARAKKGGMNGILSMPGGQ